MRPATWDEPLEAALGRIVRPLLEKAKATALRLDDARDAEALHDFRVSLRRLHTLLRAYRKFMKKDLPKAHVKDLKAIISGTNRGRDLEVWISWLKARKNRLDPKHRPLIERTILRLTRRHGEHREWLRGQIKAEFEDLRADLSRLFTPAAPKQAPSKSSLSYGTASRKIIRRYSRQLESGLSAVESEKQREEIHRARIGAKRLRYVLEPFMGLDAGTRKAVNHLKEIQDSLGAIHDLQVLSEELTETSAKGLPGRAFDEILGLLEDERQALFREFQKKWLKVRLLFWGPLSALARRLA